jgi:tetratricopeptide (TPR) repeat protein
VVDGRVDRIGHDRYNVLLRALKVEDGRVLTVASDSSSDATIIPTTRRLATSIGAALVKSKSEAIVLPSLGQANTASFEAYRLYVAAQGVAIEDGVRLLRRAVALDTAFAAAWVGLAEGLSQSTLPGSRDAYAHALSFADRLTGPQRAVLEARLARRDDPLRALQVWDAVIRENPASAEAYHDRGLVLRQLARFDEAAESMKRAAQLSPLGPQSVYLDDFAITLADIGRVQEARAFASRLDGALRRDAEIHIALASSEWSRADSLAIVQEDDPANEPNDRYYSAMTDASCSAVRGRIAAARTAISRGEAYRPGDIGMDLRLELLRLVTGQKLAARHAKKLAPDSTAGDSLSSGLRQLWNGDTAAARLELRALRARPNHEGTTLLNGIVVLDGWISAGAQQWTDVVNTLGSLAWRGNYTAPSTGLTASRWLVADAYEHLNRPDSAAGYFELLVRPVRMHPNEQLTRGLVYSFAQRRLALLYTRMRLPALAREHWLAFLGSFTNPDPDFVSLVEEARVAVARTP